MEILPRISDPIDLRRMKIELLPKLCGELREKIVSTISKNGGHLGSSLGAVEIITALHYVFETPKDKLIFDTGHQAYAHKLLTGRFKQFDNIRKKGGISGFLKRNESEYDVFGGGHASTALSAALGVAAARDQKGEDYKVVAVVSDGCMTGGMSYEALQNAGQLGTDMLIILNDNQMFISNRVGALGAFLTKMLTKDSVRNAEKKMTRFLDRFDFWGAHVLRVAKRARVMFFPGMLFEEMGVTYFGPVDGHNVQKLIEILGHIKELKGPVLLHVVTKKGKGYTPAEERPIAYHGLGIFDKMTGKPAASKAFAPSYTKVFSETLVQLAETDHRIVAVTAAMPEGTGLDAFRDKFPNRYYDVGIAEEHAVTFAAGMAAEGLIPVVALYSSFSQRAYDQMMHDACLQKLPVILALDRAGLVGEDGPTHHGVFDMSFLRTLPGIVIAAPSDENELRHVLKTAVNAGKPFVLRYPRGAGTGADLSGDPQTLEIGKGRWLRKGGDVAILAIGNRVAPALEAAELLAAKGIEAAVADMRFVKPLDGAIIKEAAKTGHIVTCEDNALAGGFGSAVTEYAADNGLTAQITRLGIPDHFVEHGKPAELYEDLGLTGKAMAKKIAGVIPGKTATKR